jgi:TonB family protein
MRVKWRLLVSSALTTACHVPTPAPRLSPYTTAVCPIPATVRPYSIVVRTLPHASIDSEWLQRVAELTGAYLASLPDSQRTVEVRAVVSRAGVLRSARLIHRSGDRAFDAAALRSVRGAFADPEFDPEPRQAAGESVQLQILYGAEPTAPNDAVRRFSMQSTLPRLLDTGHPLVLAPGESAALPAGEALAWVSFPDSGAAELYRPRALRVSDRRLEAATRSLVPQLRFVPGMNDCRPGSYVQAVRFTFRGGNHAYATMVQ